jgi:hypothetical protein
MSSVRFGSLCARPGCAALTEEAEDKAPPGSTVAADGRQFTLGATGKVAGIGDCTAKIALGLAKGEFEDRRQEVLTFTRGS